MQFVRKLVAKSAKLIVKYAPKKWVDNLKQNPKLLAAYSNNLHKSGLMYQLQTIEELNRSYVNYIQHQNKLVKASLNSNLVSKCNTSLVVCVTHFEPNDFLVTLNSIKSQHTAFLNIVFLCANNIKAQLRDFLNFHLGSPFILSDNIDHELNNSDLANKPCFVVYSGDSLDPYAAHILMTKISASTKLAYVDTDTLDNKGEKGFPDFKPNWNPDLQLTAGYVSSGLWLHSFSRLSEFSRPLNLFSVSIYLCQYYLHKQDCDIEHIPLIVLSRPKETVVFSDAKAQLKVIYNDCAKIMDSNLPVLSLRWSLKRMPLVSIIIPTRNCMELVKECIESILNKTTYTHYEILLVDNGSDDTECIRYFEMLNEHPQITLLTYNEPFNYSAINNFGAKHAKGEVLALVNNDIEVITPDWLLNMVSHVMRDDIGCVGAKLLYGDNRIQHAGVVMGYGGGAGHGHKYFPGDHFGYMNRLIASQNYSAVTGACLLITTDDFWAVNGLNEEKLAVAFNDVDLCLKVQQLGRRNFYCAEAVLYHHESVSRGHEDTPEKILRFKSELKYLQTRWSEVIKADPAYNPNLTLKRENFAIKCLK